MNHLAVGHNDGTVTIRQIDDIENPDANGGDIKLDVIKHVITDPKEWVEVIEYNSDGTKLAIGSHDNWIYVYETNENCKYVRKAICKGHSSYITAVDWSLDSSYLRSTCGAYELLFWCPDNPGNKKQDPSGASNTVGTDWMNHSCKFGWRVDGIYPPGTDGTHVNRVELSPDNTLIATGDDYGLVNVYRNPCREEHLARAFRGHSEHVTNVKFYGEGEWLTSTGGQDQTTIQWKKAD